MTDLLKQADELEEALVQKEIEKALLQIEVGDYEEMDLD